MNSNRKKIQYLLMNKGLSSNVSNDILDFIKQYKITIVNKFEEIDDNFTKFNLKMKKGDKEIALNLKISRDYLFTSVITFQGKDSKITTRDLSKIMNYLKDIFLR